MKLATALAFLGLFAGVAHGAEKKDRDDVRLKGTATDQRGLGYGGYRNHYSEFCDITGMYETLESPLHAVSDGYVSTDGVGRVSFVCYNEEELSNGYTEYGLPIPYDTFIKDTCYDRRHLEENLVGSAADEMMASVNPEGLDIIDFHLCSFEGIVFPDFLGKRKLSDAEADSAPIPDGTGIPNYGVVLTATIDNGHGQPICVFTQVCSVDLGGDTENFITGAKVRNNVLQFGVFLDSVPFGFFAGDPPIAPFTAFKTSQDHTHGY